MSATASTPTFVTSDKVIIGGSAALCVVSGIAHYGGWNSVAAFVVSAAAVCAPGVARRPVGRPAR